MKKQSLAQTKVFLLGLGNQKCGTTWLSSYLNHSPSYDGGIAKEYHVWDAKDITIKRDSLVGWRRGIFGDPRQRLRFQMQRCPRRYFEYFCGLYSDNVTTTGDITPSYSGLEIPRLTYIRDEFARRGVLCKAIILIRDPVSRIKSAVLFNLERGKFNEGIARGETDFGQAVQQYYRSEHCRMRTSYHLTIPRAIDVFGEAHTYVGIYESMFGAREVEQLSTFCGVEPNLEYAKVKVNSTRSKAYELESLEQEIRSSYDEVYKYCNSHFPATAYLWAHR